MKRWGVVLALGVLAVIVILGIRSNRTVAPNRAGKAVIESPPKVRRSVECSSVSVPMFKGRVDPDHVGYDLAPDVKIIKLAYFGTGANPETIGVSIPYGDKGCINSLTSAIRGFIEDALNAFQRDGTTGRSLPDGP